MNLLLYLPFLLALLFSFYIPGMVSISIVPLKLPFWEKQMMAWILGISIFIFCTYILAWLHLDLLFIGILILFSLLYFYKRKFSLIKIALDYPAVLLIVISSILFVACSYFSGYKTSAGLQFIGQNYLDGIFHIANIKNFLINFPPTHPGLAGIPLRGYHYFYDFLLSRFSIFYRFNPEDLFFRLFPLFIAVLYGAAFYFFSTKVTQNKTARLLIVFSAYFSQSLGFVFALFGQKLDATIPNSINLILDPSVLLSIAIILAVFTVLPRIKESFIYCLIIGLCIGIESQLKVYAGILLIFTYFAYLFYIHFVKKEFNKNHLICLLISGLVTAVTFLPNNWGSGTLALRPFMFYEAFILQSYFNDLHWGVLKAIYIQHHNILRIMQLYLEAIVSFLFVVLGLRLAIFVFFKKAFSTKFWRQENHFLLFFVIIISFLIPSFFAQTISPFDTKQFFWIGLAFLSIPTGLVAYQIIRNKNHIFQIVIIFVLIIFSLPANLSYISSYFGKSSVIVISNRQLVFYNTVTKIVPKESAILFLPTSFIKQPIYSALTGRNVYYEGELNIYSNLQNIYDKRKQEIFSLQKSINSCRKDDAIKLLKEIQVSYVVLPEKNNCFNQLSIVKNLYTNGMSLYKVDTSFHSL